MKIYRIACLALALLAISHVGSESANAVAQENTKPGKTSKAPASRNSVATAEAFTAYEKAGDDLALRILIKRQAQLVPTYQEWQKTRQLLHRRPGIGYSLLFKWDSVPFRGPEAADAVQLESKFNGWLNYADKMMSAGKFQTAFKYYQSVAKQLKAEIGAGHADNALLYQTTEHSMARALYGAGRFEEALNVYGWISKNYPRYREVLFEKMWAAFRANHADVALGAIASQQSTYFSPYMEPEAYLVQLYIYKKLCRVEEQKIVRATVGEFRKKLTDGEYTYVDWAKSDIETYGLYRLTQQPAKGSASSVISGDEKAREQKRIDDLLRERFAQEKTRLLRELNYVLAYSFIAVGADNLKVQAADLDGAQLRAKGVEVWPVDDAEDWLDELGNDLYLGKSQCKPK